MQALDLPVPLWRRSSALFSIINPITIKTGRNAIESLLNPGTITKDKRPRLRLRLRREKPTPEYKNQVMNYSFYYSYNQPGAPYPKHYYACKN